MLCDEEQIMLVRLFYNVSSSFLLLFTLFYFTFNLLAKILHYCGSPIFQRGHDEYGYVVSSDEEKEEETKYNIIHAYFSKEYDENDHLMADIIHDGESLQFKPANNIQKHKPHISIYEEPEEEFFCSPASESDVLKEVVEDEKCKLSGNNSEANSREVFENVNTGRKTSGSVLEHENPDGIVPAVLNEKIHTEKEKTSFRRDDNFLIFEPPKSESKRTQVPVGKKVIEDEIYGDTCTVGSTSKSSSEWRSSINCRDTGSEDPFSSSSRRSCPKWESYTVFQKYDEEMLFLDRISVQKLHETESLRSVQACPRSISERIVHKLATKKSNILHNPFYELEAAYVAHICLTWEALNWNYKYFQRLRASRQESDPGCPAYVAQQFQQFQVLLQRYVETEPYEYGRRPEIYARIRSKAPKLLQVPEYRDSNDDEKEGLGSRIPSNWFLEIMEDSIRTFMKFLKADKRSHCQIMASFFKRNRRSAVDPTRFLLLKKVNKKKKLKLKEFRRAGKCIRKRRLNQEEEMEILMALIDVKVVSRVLRMAELSEEQLSWCDYKMSKVRVGDGKFQRESSPLFFPAH